MKLNALDSNLSKILTSCTRKYQWPPILDSTSLKIAKIIVLCEGTPDNIAVALVSHHVNGSETVVVTKPDGKTNTATFELMRLYIEKNKSLKGLLFILDQEENSVQSISREFEKQINKTGSEIQSSRKEINKRLQVYTAIYGARKLNLILVINGHPDIISRKHTIEDHFIKVAAKLGRIDLPEKLDDPKDYWQKIIDTPSQERVFQSLPNNEELVEECFPQQTKGLQILKSLN
jgi:hypothetical protein